MSASESKLEQALRLVQELERRVKKVGTGKYSIKKGAEGFESPGEIIGQLRGVLGFSQPEFAKIAQVCKESVGRWERDIIVPHLSSLAALRDFLETHRGSVMTLPQLLQEWVIPVTHLNAVSMYEMPTIRMFTWLHEMEQRAGFALDEEACRILLELYERHKEQGTKLYEPDTPC